MAQIDVIKGLKGSKGVERGLRGSEDFFSEASEKS